jgi:hypothetical protein
MFGRHGEITRFSREEFIAACAAESEGVMTKTNACLPIQEEIAWGRSLAAEAQAHVFACPSCTKLSLDFALLDSAVRDADVTVPSDFADRVMAEVLKDVRSSARGDAVDRLVAKIGSIFQIRAVQFAMVALLFAFPFSGAH